MTPLLLRIDDQSRWLAPLGTEIVIQFLPPRLTNGSANHP